MPRETNSCDEQLLPYLVVPAFGLVYLVGARARWRQRLGQLALATVVLLGVSLSWVTVVDLTPASQRPYVGSSGDNSELSLALGYNGLQRLTGMLFGRSGGTTPGGGGSVGGGNALFNGGPAGLFRLLGTTLGGQVSWLLVLAVLGLVLAALCVPWRRLDGRGRSLVLWGTWLLTAGAFFSVAEFFHPYYTVMLAPAIAALAAIGVATLWRAYRARSWRGWLVPVVLLATAAVQAYILRDYPEWSHWLTPLVVGTCLVAAVVLAMARLRPLCPAGTARPGPDAGRVWQRRSRMQRMAWATLVAMGVALASLLAAPTTWAAYSVVHQTNATIPTAGPSAQTSTGLSGFGGAGGPSNGQVGPGGSPPFGPGPFGGRASGNTSRNAPFQGGRAGGGPPVRLAAAGGTRSTPRSSAIWRRIRVTPNTSWPRPAP
jgi:4-amino-4-deoxy-L-arabinose transferase-like glycosyltransferase